MPVTPFVVGQWVRGEEFYGLTGLIEEILARDEEEWTLTADERRCKYCIYRSLCDRGVEAGPFGEWDDDVLDTDPEAVADFDFDLDNVEEIAF